MTTSRFNENDIELTRIYSDKTMRVGMKDCEVGGKVTFYQNGEKSEIVFPKEMYDDIMDRICTYAEVLIAQEEINKGDTLDAENVFDEMRIKYSL